MPFIRVYFYCNSRSRSVRKLLQSDRPDNCRSACCGIQEAIQGVGLRLPIMSGQYSVHEFGERNQAMLLAIHTLVT